MLFRPDMSDIQEEENQDIESADMDADQSEATENARGDAGDLPPDGGEEEVTTESGALTPEMEVEKWRDVAARAQADLDNFRKRMVREKTEAIQYANRSLFESLFPIIDNFEMGLRAARDADGEESVIFQGMQMVFRQIEDFLSENGVTPVDADGQVFDPNIHEAIKQEPSDTVPEGTVIFAVRRGYRLKDRILRAANVIVSSGPEGQE